MNFSFNKYLVTTVKGEKLQGGNYSSASFIHSGHIKDCRNSGSARIAQGLSSRGVTPDSTKATEHGREKKRQGEIFAQYDPPTSS